MYAQFCTSQSVVKKFTCILDLYYEAFPNDRLSVNYLVYGVYLIELARTILVTHDAFGSFGYGFGNIETLTNIHLNWLTVPILGGIGTCALVSSSS